MAKKTVEKKKTDGPKSDTISDRNQRRIDCLERRFEELIAAIGKSKPVKNI